jgi:hypothetical protein
VRRAFGFNPFEDSDIHVIEISRKARRDCGKASYDDLGMCDHRPKHHSLSVLADIGAYPEDVRS